MNFQRVVSAQGTVCPLPISRPSQDCPQQSWMLPASSAATGPEQGRICLWVPRLPLEEVGVSREVGLRYQGKKALG